MHRRKGDPESIAAVRRLRVLTALAILTATTLQAQLWNVTPTNLNTWADLDAAVANTYASFSNEFMIFPAGTNHYAFGQGYVTFSPDGELAALTNLCACSTQFCVQAWHMSVIEAQTTPRAWLYLGAGGAAFRTNDCPSSYDPIQWVIHAYGVVPRYLSGTNLANWYASRERSRFVLNSTFVSLSDWPTLQATVLAAAQAAGTNAPPPGNSTPTLPPDTNNMAFVSIQPSAEATGLWIYTPATRPVAVLMSTSLIVKTWALLGSFDSTPPFNQWNDTGNTPAAFYRAGFTDVSSSGNGLPDVIGAYVLGTDTNYFDTTGSPLGDYVRIMIYGLSPDSTCTVGDGIPDAWKIAYGLNPLDPTLADQDPDGDGLSNMAEYLLGTNPNIPSTFDASNGGNMRIASPLSR